MLNSIHHSEIKSGCSGRVKTIMIVRTLKSHTAAYEIMKHLVLRWSYEGPQTKFCLGPSYDLDWHWNGVHNMSYFTRKYASE